MLQNLKLKSLSFMFVLLLIGSIFLPIVGAETNDEVTNAGTKVAIEVGQEEVIDSFVTNEYDYVTNLKQVSDTELKKMGYSTEEISIIKNSSFEKALFERAQLPEDVLYGYGYNASQIALLKSYDGSPLEDNPQMMAAVSNFTAQITKKSYSRNNMSASFNWVWTTAPVILTTDVIACGFSAVGNGSVARVVIASEASSVVTYIHGNIYNVSHRSAPVYYQDVNHHVETKIPMTYNNGWAQSGTFTVKVTEAVSGNNLDSANFAFGYGHSTYGITPSIGVTIGGTGAGAGISLSFNSMATAMYYSTMVLRYDGYSQLFPGM